MLFGCVPIEPEPTPTPTPTPKPTPKVEEKHTPASITLSNFSTKESTIRNAIKYAKDIKEIKWIEIDDNDIYVGFKPVPSDWKPIIIGIALSGNKAINYGVHTWAVNSGQKGWRPGQGSYIGKVTARYGKIQ